MPAERWEVTGPGSASSAFQLTVIYPGGEWREFRFEGQRIFLGRSPGNQVRLAHPFVASRHLSLQPRGGAFALRDLGSLEGIRIAGRRLEPRAEHRLAEGEEFEIGPLRLRAERILEARRVADPAPGPPRPEAPGRPPEGEDPGGRAAGENRARPTVGNSHRRVSDDSPLRLVPPVVGVENLDRQLLASAHARAFLPARFRSEWRGVGSDPSGMSPTDGRKKAGRSFDLPWFRLFQLLGGVVILLAIAALLTVILI